MVGAAPEKHVAEDVAITSGQSTSGTVAVNAWAFAHLQLSQHSYVSWNVLQVTLTMASPFSMN
jgi:hypothetical protein